MLFEKLLILTIVCIDQLQGSELTTETYQIIESIYVSIFWSTHDVISDLYQRSTQKFKVIKYVNDLLES